jgi:hypothetical protein
MSGVAYRLAGVVYALNSTIANALSLLAFGLSSYAGVYSWLTAAGLQKAYSLLAFPAVLFIPWLVTVIAGFPLGFIHYVLTGHFHRAAARQEYAALRFASLNQQLYGAPPSKDEIDKFLSDMNSRRESWMPFLICGGTAMVLAALVLGGALGYQHAPSVPAAASEQDLLKGAVSAQLRRCWRQAAGDGVETIIVTVRWRLRRDGSLDGEPQVEDPEGSPAFQIAAAAAVGAVKACAPFRLPADKYSKWRTIIWDFDPREML